MSFTEETLVFEFKRKDNSVINDSLSKALLSRGTNVSVGTSFFNTAVDCVILNLHKGSFVLPLKNGVFTATGESYTTSDFRSTLVSQSTSALITLPNGEEFTGDCHLIVRVKMSHKQSFWS